MEAGRQMPRLAIRFSRFTFLRQSVLVDQGRVTDI